MNIIRQREELKAMRALKVINANQLHLSLQSPVFMWNGSKHEAYTDAEWEWLTTNVLELTPKGGGYPIHMPFPVFRISYTDASVWEQWLIGPDTGFCLRSDSGYSHPKVNLWSLHQFWRSGDQVKFWAWANGVQMDEYGWSGKIQMVSTDREKQLFANAPMRFLGRFLFDTMSSSNVVLRVTPSQTGRSVEWVTARTHYLVLDKKLAHQCRERKGGPTEGELVRAAHWRRAHFRKLVSEKFKHKKGTQVRVKQAWVGPEEWVGLDNKIYKVQHLPE